MQNVRQTAAQGGKRRRTPPGYHHERKRQRRAPPPPYDWKCKWDYGRQPGSETLATAYAAPTAAFGPISSNAAPKNQDMELSWGAPEDHNSHSQLQCAPDVVSHKSPPKQQPDVRQHGNDEKGAATSAPVHNSATSPTTVKQTNKEGYKNLQNLLRRIIQQEFTTKCTQRSIAILQIICDTLCSDPVGVVKVMEVLNDQFEAAIKAEQQQQLLNYWYIVDAVLKLFRDRPAMLNAVTVALPHMLIRYVPWQKSALAKESWIQCERDSALYENLFRTWERTVSKNLMDDIWALWKGEVDLELDGKAGTSTE